MPALGCGGKVMWWGYPCSAMNLMHSSIGSTFVSHGWPFPLKKEDSFSNSLSLSQDCRAGKQYETLILRSIFIDHEILTRGGKNYEMKIDEP